jgi:hypothetical protein
MLSASRVKHFEPAYFPLVESHPKQSGKAGEPLNG